MFLGNSMVTSPLRRENMRMQNTVDPWCNGVSGPFISRWVEFDFEKPHLYRLMERDECSGIEVTQFYYLVNQNELRFMLLSNSGRFLERFDSLNALKLHACLLLNFDRIGAEMAFPS